VSDPDAVALDSSVLIAVLSDEPDRRGLLSRIARFPRRIISAATLLETRIVWYSRQGEGAVARLDSLIVRLRIEIVPLTPGMADLAFDAFRRFGKGVGEPAVLNFGDCFSYALARSANVPLLFKGDDFALTDIAAA